MNISYASKFIKNYTEELPVDGNESFKALEDQNNKPLIFSHSTDDKLYVLSQKDGTTTGWIQINLIEGLGKDKTLTAFDVFKDSTSGLIHLCAAVVGTDKTNELYIARNINTTDVTFGWENFSSKNFWKKIPIPDPQATINLTLLDKEGLFMASLKAEADARYYHVNETGSFEINKENDYELPEHGSQILSMALGRMRKTRGFFLLYEIGGAQTLLFHGFPDPKYGKMKKFRFDVRKDISKPKTSENIAKLSTITLVEDEDSGNHHLYVAGEGLFCFEAVDQRKDIIPSLAGFFFKNFQISQKQEKLSCWLLEKNSNTLFYMYNDPSSRKWSPPVALKKDIEQFACVRSQDIRNHLFYVDNRQHLYHFFEDEASTLWHDSFVPVEGTGVFRESVAYLTEINFAGEKYNLPNDLTIKLTSPSNLYITINDAFYQIGPNHAVELPFNGEDLIISHTLNSGLVDAFLCLTGSFMKESKVIDMASSIYDRIQHLVKNNLKDFKGLKKKDGTPLIPDKYKSEEDTLKMVAEAIQYFLDFRKDCKDKVCDHQLLTNAAIATSPVLLKAVAIYDPYRDGSDRLIMRITQKEVGGILVVIGIFAIAGTILVLAPTPDKLAAGGPSLGGGVLLIVASLALCSTGLTLILTADKKAIPPSSESKTIDPPKKPDPQCDSMILDRKPGGCKGSLTIYDTNCQPIKIDLNVNHMLACITMMLNFIGITPSDLPEWPTDNDDCVYRGLLY